MSSGKHVMIMVYVVDMIWTKMYLKKEMKQDTNIMNQQITKAYIDEGV